MNSEDLRLALAVPFRFERRPVDLAASLRPAWAISLVLLLLSRSCRGGKSSIARLHVLNWATRDAGNADLLLEHLAGRVSPLLVPVRYDPSLDRALEFGVADDLLRRPNGSRVELAPRGRAALELLDRDSVLLADERALLGRIGLRLTEEAVSGLVAGGES